MFKVFYWLLVADCTLLTYAGGELHMLIVSRLGAALLFCSLLSRSASFGEDRNPASAPQQYQPRSITSA
jgi:hypothetical protein